MISHSFVLSDERAYSLVDNEESGEGKRLKFSALTGHEPV